MPPKHTSSGSRAHHARSQALNRAHQNKHRNPSNHAASHHNPTRSFTSTGADHPHQFSAGRSGGGAGNSLRHDTTRRRALEWKDAHSNPSSSYLSDTIRNAFQRSNASEMFNDIGEADEMLMRPSHEQEFEEMFRDHELRHSLDNYARAPQPTVSQQRERQHQYEKAYTDEQNGIYQRNFHIDDKGDYTHESGVHFPKPPTFDLNSGYSVHASTASHHTAGIGLDGDSVDHKDFSDKSSFKNPFWNTNANPNDPDRPISAFNKDTDTGDREGEGFTMKEKYDPNMRGSLHAQRMAFEEARQKPSFSYGKFGEDAWARSKARKEERRGYLENLDDQLASKAAYKQAEHDSYTASDHEAEKRTERVLNRTPNNKPIPIPPRPLSEQYPLHYSKVYSRDTGKYDLHFAPKRQQQLDYLHRISLQHPNDKAPDRAHEPMTQREKDLFYERRKRDHQREFHEGPWAVSHDRDAEHLHHAHNTERNHQLSELNRKIDLLRAQVSDLDVLQNRVAQLRGQFLSKTHPSMNQNQTASKDWLSNKIDQTKPLKTQLIQAIAKQNIADSKDVNRKPQEKNVHRVVDGISAAREESELTLSALLHHDVAVTPAALPDTGHNHYVSATPTKIGTLTLTATESSEQSTQQNREEKQEATSNTADNHPTTASDSPFAPPRGRNSKPAKKQPKQPRKVRKTTNTSLGAPVRVKAIAGATTLIIPRSVETKIALMNTQHQIERDLLLDEVHRLSRRIYKLHSAQEDMTNEERDQHQHDHQIVYDQAETEIAVLERRLDEAFERSRQQMEDLQVSYEKALNINREQQLLEEEERNEYIAQRQKQYQDRQKHIQQSLEEQQQQQQQSDTSPTLKNLTLSPQQDIMASPAASPTPIEIQPLFHTSALGPDRPIGTYQNNQNPLAMPTTDAKAYQLNKVQHDSYRHMLHQSVKQLESPVIMGMAGNTGKIKSPLHSAHASPQVHIDPILTPAMKQITEFMETRESPYHGAMLDFTPIPTFDLDDDESGSVLQLLRNHKIKPTVDATSRNHNVLLANDLNEDEVTVANFKNPLTEVNHRSTHLPQIHKHDSTTFLPPPNIVNDVPSPVQTQHSGLNKNSFIPASPNLTPSSRSPQSPDHQPSPHQHPIVEIQPMHHQVKLSDIDPNSNVRKIVHDRQITADSNYSLPGMDPTFVNKVRVTHRPDQPDQNSATNDVVERILDTML